MITKHTEGPWKYNGPWSVHAGYFFTITSETGQDIATVDAKRGIAYPEGVGNAQLIAKAPELLQRLKQASLMLDGLITHCETQDRKDWGAARGFVAELETLIREAEGRS